MSSNVGQNEWEASTYKDDMLETNHGRINIVVQGPARQPGEPVVVIIPGLAGPYHTWYAVVKRLGPEVRVVQFNRAGLGRSDNFKTPRTAQNIAAEIEEVLTTAGIKPPYIIVSQSYGGIISREFLARCTQDEIVGFVLVDANTEYTHARLESMSEHHPILQQIKYLDAIGWKQEGHLTDEEAAIVLNEDEGANGAATATDEMKYTLESARLLGEREQYKKRVLDPHPVIVIRGDLPRDFQRICAYAKEKGLGTPEQFQEIVAVNERIEKHHDDLQTEQLQLSGNNRYVVPKDSGHNIWMWEPQFIADEINLLLKCIKTGTRLDSQL